MWFAVAYGIVSLSVYQNADFTSFNKIVQIENKADEQPVLTERQIDEMNTEDFFL